MSSEQHWNAVYRTKGPDAVSWYAPHLGRSLALITSAAPDRTARIVDVGAGASTLADDLLERGYRRLCLLDLSEAALAATRRRLGARGNELHWLVGDVTTADLPEACFDVWHDRAAFHFLVDPRQRAAYAARLARSLAPGGHAIIATFAPDGPPRCSGLPVVRYTALELGRELGERFALVDACIDQHVAPSGGSQAFLYCRFRRR